MLDPVAVWMYYSGYMTAPVYLPLLDLAFILVAIGIFVIRPRGSTVIMILIVALALTVFFPVVAYALTSLSSILSSVATGLLMGGG